MAPDTTETWKPVLGYEGIYEVSDHGNVRSLKRTVTFKDGRKRTWPSACRTTQPRESGNLNVMLHKDGKPGESRHVAQMVMESFVFPRPEGMEVCHGNGDPTDNRLDNLRWDTRQGNVRDCIAHGNNVNLNKTTCPRGHSLKEPNLVGSALRRGRRECLACNRGRGVVRWRKSRGIDITFKEASDMKYAELISQ